MDPTRPLPHSDNETGADSPDEAPASLELVIAAQLELAKTIQEKLRSEKDSMAPRDYKDLVAASSSIVGLAHRTDEALKLIKTYQVFADIVMEFLRSRSDQLGVDLVAELAEVAKVLKAESAAGQVIVRHTLKAAA